MSSSRWSSAASSGHPLLQQVPAVHIRLWTSPAPIRSETIKKEENVPPPNSDLTNDRQRWLCLHDIQHGKLTRKLFCYYMQFATSHSRLTSLATGISSGLLSVFTYQITEQMSFLFMFFLQRAVSFDGCSRTSASKTMSKMLFCSLCLIFLSPATYMSWTTMYWCGTSPSTPLCRPSHQSSEALWNRSRDAPFLNESSRLVRPE